MVIVPVGFLWGSCIFKTVHFRMCNTAELQTSESENFKHFSTVSPLQISSENQTCKMSEYNVLFQKIKNFDHTNSSQPIKDFCETIAQKIYRLS